MISEKEKDAAEASPSIYSREQFEQEAGVRHADQEYAAELTPPRAVTWGEAMGRYDAPIGSRAMKGRTEPSTERISGEDSDYDPLAAVGALVEEEEAVVNQNKSLGIVALVLAAISLFFLPAILGPASIIVGFAAFVRGNRTLGVWSMALGFISVAAYFILVPYYT